MVIGGPLPFTPLSWRKHDKIPVRPCRRTHPGRSPGHWPGLREQERRGASRVPLAPQLARSNPARLRGGVRCRDPRPELDKTQLGQAPQRCDLALPPPPFSPSSEGALSTHDLLVFAERKTTPIRVVLFLNKSKEVGQKEVWIWWDLWGSYRTTKISDPFEFAS